MKDVGIIGASGYTGGELLRIFSRHPGFQVTWATSRQYAGRPAGEVFPHLRDFTDIVLTDPDLDRWLSDAAPRSMDTSELVVSHRMEVGGWVPVGLELKTDGPFQQQVACGAWVAEFLRRCDGERSAMVLLQSMKADGTVPEDAPANEFIAMVNSLAAAGFLQFDDL